MDKFKDFADKKKQEEADKKRAKSGHLSWKVSDVEFHDEGEKKPVNEKQNLVNPRSDLQKKKADRLDQRAATKPYHSDHPDQLPLKFKGDTNEPMRASKGRKNSDHKKELDHITSHTTKQPMTVYRGIHSEEFHNKKVGSTFTDHGYTGTSIAPHVARGFAHDADFSHSVDERGHRVIDLHVVGQRGVKKPLKEEEINELSGKGSIDQLGKYHADRAIKSNPDAKYHTIQRNRAARLRSLRDHSGPNPAATKHTAGRKTMLSFAAQDSKTAKALRDKKDS